MRKVIGAAFVSLDGVMQAPGGPEEDRTGGFGLGGWLAPYFDSEVGEWIDALFAGPFDLLLGRRTYDIFAAHWPFVEGDEKELGDRFDHAAKFVMTNRAQPLEWRNSHRLASLDALAEVKRGDGPDLVIQGSSTLYPQLLRAGLIDRLTLLTFPLVLGSGKRLLGDGTPSCSMRMIEHRVTPGGNVIATYEPSGEVEPGSFVTIEPSAASLPVARRWQAAGGEPTTVGPLAEGGGSANATAGQGTLRNLSCGVATIAELPAQLPFGGRLRGPHVSERRPRAAASDRNVGQPAASSQPLVRIRSRLTGGAH